MENKINTANALAKRPRGRQLAGEQLQKLVVLGMLIAMYFVLDRFLAYMTLSAKLGLMFVPPMVAAALYGPAEGAIVYALGDLAGSLLIQKGAPLPGLTVTYALIGIVYGLFLNEAPLGAFKVGLKWKKMGWLNYIAASAIACLALDLLLKTMVLNRLSSDKTYGAMLALRLPAVAIMLGLNIVFCPIVTRLAATLRKVLRLKTPEEKLRAGKS